ncbi:vancomycin resistance protein YoaR [Anaerobacterium chartisolvens]|uniref:Vancomycin resistance protein YoaR n=1 Tax=Anaerobacterium chartisolvens TaxID=1297424 RepID=A0A369B6D6_9FIRM|nr:VanW family protein [Anaerobacterium chartisolvens]RCX16097.1 vancomycin resistance protein YoaR [Anaerobacterium chartisolvens]
METSVQNIEPQKKQAVKFISRKVIVISLITFILLMLAITAQLGYTLLNSDRVYKGIYINDIYAGNLSKEELTETLNLKYQKNLEELELNIVCKGVYNSLPFSSINAAYDVKVAVDSAFNIGREGSLLSKLGDIFKARHNGIKLSIPVLFSEEKANEVIQSIYSKTLVDVKQSDFSIREDKLIIRRGHSGERIDRIAALRELTESIKNLKTDTLKIPVETVYPDAIDVDGLYGKVTRRAQDASFKVENNKLEIIPEVIGISVDKSKIAQAVSELEKGQSSEKVVPLTTETPKITTADVHSRLFKDNLYTMKTHFNTNTENNLNRSQNIKIAASKINGIILAPGQIFSFNETVGKRTVDAGYKDAYIYKSGKVVSDLAGGICQVSSTLYNAVLHSDLEVVERRNHMFSVVYVPEGRDATVFYGSTDFRFKNSTKWPIKIDSQITKDNYLVFSLKGTNETPGKTVEFTSSKRNEKPFTTNYTDDPNLPEGTTKVIQEGHNGAIIDTFKTVKQDGKVIEKIKITTSVYQPLVEEVVRGTKKVQQTPSNKDPLNEGNSVPNSEGQNGASTDTDPAQNSEPDSFLPDAESDSADNAGDPEGIPLDQLPRPDMDDSAINDHINTEDVI